MMAEQTGTKTEFEMQLNHYVAGLVNIFLVSSTSESRQMGMDLIDDLLVAYCGVIRDNEPRSAQEVQADLRQNGYARFEALHDALPVGEDVHFNNDKERAGVKFIMKQLEKLGVIESRQQERQAGDKMQEKNWQEQLRREQAKSGPECGRG